MYIQYYYNFNLIVKNIIYVAAFSVHCIIVCTLHCLNLISLVAHIVIVPVFVSNLLFMHVLIIASASVFVSVKTICP